MIPGDAAWTALAAAVGAGDVPAVRRALAASPGLRSRLDEPIPGGPFGATALLWAVHRGQRALISVLLDAGADINARSHWWAGSFGVLDHDGDRSLAEWLITCGARVDAHAAARLGMLDRLRELLAADPSLVHARGGDGQTPLHFARDVAVAECLLAQGADINARDVDHESTPVQWMVRDRQEVARYLVSRGCRTDLLLAAALGDAALVRGHLEEDPDCIRLTVSPKHFPMTHHHAGGCIYTWTLGADKTASVVARDFGHADLERFLLERTPADLRFAVAALQGDRAEFESLRAAHPELLAQRMAEDPARIALAAKANNTAAVTLMADAGWPVEARGQHGGTPLHWAAFHGNLEMVKALLSCRPPLELKDDEFHATPLGWAIHGSGAGWYKDTGDYVGVVKALLAAGAVRPERDGGSPQVQELLRRRGGGTADERG